MKDFTIKCIPVTWNTDTLLNVFLAIAVDNLGNAQALTAAEERAELSEQVPTAEQEFPILRRFKVVKTVAFFIGGFLN